MDVWSVSYPNGWDAFLSRDYPVAFCVRFPQASSGTQLKFLVFGENTTAEQPLDGKSEAFTCREGRAG